MKLLDFITGRRNESEKGNESPGNNKQTDTNVSYPVSAVNKDEPQGSMKPSGMSDEDYRAALSIFPPERIRELYQGFDARAVEPFYEQLYRQTRQAPVAPNEKRIKAARTLANFGDALGLIVQSIAASQGSYIDPRNPELSSSSQTARGISKLKEAYAKSRNAYDLGILAAQKQDIEGGRQRWDKDRNTLLDFLLKMRDNARQDKRFQGEMVYRYERLKGDEADRADRRRQHEAANWLARAKLDFEQQKINGGVTPTGYLDFYDRNTGVTYRVPERKWKANFTQIFNQIKGELYKQYPLLRTDERLGKLKANEKEEYVKQFMYSNPDALGFLEDIAERKFQDGQPARRPEQVKLKQTELEAMQRIVEEGTKRRIGERETLVSLSRYLKEQGYKREQIEQIIKTITYGN